MSPERGIILGPDAEIDVATNRVHIRTTEPNSLLLRHAVLYWDKIDFPQNNMIHVESQDINFLMQAGIAQTTQIQMAGGGEMAALYVAAQFAAFSQLNNQNPEMWTLGQYAKHFSGLPQQISQAQLAEIEINNVLPIPPDDVPLADILELKQKHKDEFRSLRIAVDQLYDEVLRSAQIPRAEGAAIHQLQSAIADIRKLVDQSWLDRITASIKFDFNVPSTLTNSGIGYWTGQSISATFGIPGLEYVGAAAGVALSNIKFETKVGSVLAGLPEHAKNFAYLYHVEKAFPGTLKA